MFSPCPFDTVPSKPHTPCDTVRSHCPRRLCGGHHQHRESKDGRGDPPGRAPQERVRMAPCGRQRVCSQATQLDMGVAAVSCQGKWFSAVSGTTLQRSDMLTQHVVCVSPRARSFMYQLVRPSANMTVNVTVCALTTWQNSKVTVEAPVPVPGNRTVRVAASAFSAVLQLSVPAVPGRPLSPANARSAGCALPRCAMRACLRLPCALLTLLC